MKIKKLRKYLGRFCVITWHDVQTETRVALGDVAYANFELTGKLVFANSKKILVEHERSLDGDVLGDYTILHPVLVDNIREIK